jgi:hypothetical protein
VVTLSGSSSTALTPASESSARAPQPVVEKGFVLE